MGWCDGVIPWTVIRFTEGHRDSLLTSLCLVSFMGVMQWMVSGHRMLCDGLNAVGGGVTPVEAVGAVRGGLQAVLEPSLVS